MICEELWKREKYFQFATEVVAADNKQKRIASIESQRTRWRIENRKPDRETERKREI